MTDTSRVRFGTVGIVTMSLFAALFARLWFLQVMTAPEYQVAAENNRVRVVQVEAPRGRLLDRKSNILVDNRRTIAVTVDWQVYTDLEPPEQDALLTKLALTLTRDRDRQDAGTVGVGDPGAVPLPADEDPENPDDPDATTTTPPPSTTTTSLPEGTVSTETTVREPITADTLRGRLADPRFSHFKPVPVATDISEDLELYLTEHAAEYPTVAAERVTVRNYRYGQLLAHVLGYVGAVNEDDLEQYQNDAKPYERDDEVGKSGIERLMEKDLRGVPGEVRYEVDARNRPIRRIGGKAPVPGNDVYLSVDIDLQYIAEKSLAAQLGLSGTICDRRGCYDGSKSGSVVVTDPLNGQVLAMASYPTYDPAEFTGGISTEAYAALTAEDNQRPLLNRAIAGTYAPGSTWKLFSAYSGLENNQIVPGAVVYDPGYYKIPGCQGAEDACEKQNASRQQHGNVNLTSALTVSSDVYFYKLADEMWKRRETVGEDALARTYRTWGFGAKTGLGLAGESAGRVPDPEWLREFSKVVNADDPDRAEELGRWNSGINMNTAIGQGDVLVTPLQLANGYATFANGGIVFRPQFVLQVTKGYSGTAVSAFEAEEVRRIPFQPDWYASMMDGFKGVTTTGTARATFEGFPQENFQVAGKTGTAQVDGKADTSLFTAYAPADAARFAVAAILPEGGNGGDAAAPLVRRILEPIAKAGGSLVFLPKAPEGGSFDAEAVAEEVVAPSSNGGD